MTDVELRWLGQAGFEISGAGRTLLVDPFLAPHPDRLVPPAFEPATATRTDAIFCTHDHLDHLDHETLPVLASASPACTIVVPEPCVDVVVELGIDAQRVIGARVGEAIALDGVVAHPVAASHAMDPADGYGLGDGRFLGYVFEIAGVRVYHAGDTIGFDGLEEQVQQIGVDVALLPINGRDREREALGMAGNLDEREAAHVAAAIGADIAVPMHFDMFAANPGDPGRFASVARNERLPFTVVVLGYEHPFRYSR